MITRPFKAASFDTDPHCVAVPEEVVDARKASAAAYLVRD